MRLPLVLPMFGIAVLLSGCANRLTPATQAPIHSAVTVVSAPAHTPPPAASTVEPRGYVVVRTTTRPVTRVVRSRPVVVAPRATVKRMQPAKCAPTPCTEAVLYTPGVDCVFDPCDPCAGGRCSIPK